MKRCLFCLMLSCALCFVVSSTYIVSAEQNMATKTTVINANNDSIILKADGSVWHLSSGEMVFEGAISITGGYPHTFALKENGEVWGWGYMDHRLGTGEMIIGEFNQTPTKILDDVEQIAYGIWHTMAVKTDGSLWAWGDNGTNRFGDGNGGGDWMVYDKEYDSPIPVLIMRNIDYVAAGYFQTSAIKKNGELWTWGTLPRSGFGALNPDTHRGYGQDPYKMMDDVKMVSVGDGHHAAVKNNGELWLWGNNEAGQLGDGTTENRYYRPSTAVKAMDDVAEAAAGGWHTLALKTDGSLWAFGANSYGQLGDGTFEYRYTPVKIMDNVVAISAGFWHSLAVTGDGVLWAWGNNRGNKLGVDVGETSNIPVRVMNGIMLPGEKIRPLTSEEIIISKEADPPDEKETPENGERGLTVWLNRELLIFEGQPPILDNGRTLVPFRGIFEALGTNISWDSESQTVTAQRGMIVIQLTIGETTAYINKDAVELDVPAKIVNDRTLVPVRFVAESMNCIVEWDRVNLRVNITSDN